MKSTGSREGGSSHIHTYKTNPDRIAYVQAIGVLFFAVFLYSFDLVTVEEFGRTARSVEGLDVREERYLEV